MTPPSRSVTGRPAFLPIASNGGGLESEAECVADAAGRRKCGEYVEGDGGVQAKRGRRKVMEDAGHLRDAWRAPGACGSGLAHAGDAVVHVHPDEQRVAVGLGGVQSHLQVAKRNPDSAPFHLTDAHDGGIMGGGGGEGQARRCFAAPYRSGSRGELPDYAISLVTAVVRRSTALSSSGRVSSCGSVSRIVAAASRDAASRSRSSRRAILTRAVPD